MQFKVPKPKTSIVGGGRACGVLKIRLTHKVQTIHGRCFIAPESTLERADFSNTIGSGLNALNSQIAVAVMGTNFCKGRSSCKEIQSPSITPPCDLINKNRTHPIGISRQLSVQRRLPIKQLHCYGVSQPTPLKTFAFYLLVGRTRQINEITKKLY